MTDVFVLDLVDEGAAAEEYERLHREVWPEVLDHLRERGFTRCQIFRAGDRLVMLVEGGGGATDGGELPARVLEWEDLVGRYQKRLSFAGEGQKWVRADIIFDWMAEDGGP